MKSYLYTLFALLLLSTIGLANSTYAQTYDVILCGNVTDSTGNGVGFHDVTVKFDTVPNAFLLWGYNATVTTDQAGNWCDTVQVPTGVMQGTWTVCTLDCDTVTVLDTTGWYSQNVIGNVFTGLDFAWCAGASRTCAAYFTSGGQALNVIFSDGSVGQTNVISWSWDFGDGNGSTMQNPTHTYAIAGNYNVCLTITTSGGCSNTYCSIVSPGNTGGGNGPWNIGGSLIDTSGVNGPASPGICGAMVYLIEHDQGAGTLTAVDSTQVDTTGLGCFYEFRNVPTGDYLIKGALLPANPDYANIMPTYYLQDLFWSGATTVTVNQNMNALNILMIAGTNPGGPGFVGGLITQGANKTHGPGDPVTNAEVLLLNMDNSPVQYTYTDANGDYSFSNVAYGTYQIWTEIWGKTVTPIIVTLSPTTPTLNNQNITVNSADIVAGFEVPEIMQNLKVYPNPTSGTGIIEMNVEQAGVLNLRITDLAGRIVQQDLQLLETGANTLDFDLGNQAPGLYFLQLELDGGTTVHKVVRK